jgi:uncharacterized protein (TIGR00369 family)
LTLLAGRRENRAEGAVQEVNVVMSEPGRDPAWTARGRGVLEVPLHRFLGIRLIDDADPSAGIWFPVTEQVQTRTAFLHGSVLTTLIDVASYLALLPHLDPTEHAITHDVSASLLRAVPADSRVELRGQVLRRGRAVAFMRAEATVDGHLVASGQVTKSVVPAR